MTTITNEQYEAACAAAQIEASTGGHHARRIVNCILFAAGVEVEKTPEQRIAGFVADYMARGHAPTLCWLNDLVRAHFPEVKRDA